MRTPVDADRIAEASDVRPRAIPLRLQTCETAEYHRALWIQPHAVFLALRAGDGGIVQASANAPACLGGDLASLLGRSFASFLDEPGARRLEGAIAGLDGEDMTARATVTLALPSHAADAVLYRSDALICLEFARAPEPSGAAPLPTAPDFFTLMARISHSPPAADGLADIGCSVLREVSGFDRLYYCEFDEDGHGHVLGEALGDALPSLRDHHFPATDIPAAARRMLALNPFRHIPDIDAMPVPILGDEGPLDLTMSTCRAVAPSHLQYMRNMGVQASFSLPVMRNGRLHALFGGHHVSPKTLSYRQLATAAHAVELFRSREDALRARDERALLTARIDDLNALIDDFAKGGNALHDFLGARQSCFRALMDADDVICAFEADRHLGQSLAPDDAHALLVWLGDQLPAQNGIIVTSRLGEQAPALARLAPAVCGLIAVALDPAARHVVAWLRREVALVETWSGDPYAPALADGQGGFSPRTSFLSYLRQVKGASLPWQAGARTLAHQVRHAMNQMRASHFERAMRQAAEQATRVKSEFVASISHELRSPLHAIIGFAEVLVRADAGLPVEKRRRHAEAIRHSGSRLLALVCDLLDLSKMSAGKMGFRMASGDLGDVVRGAIDEIGEMARGRQITIAITDDRHARRACFDRERMSQVLINLLSNALKYGRAGSVITVALSEATAGTAVSQRIEVADRGVGIPEGELELIFERFSQSTRTKNGAGGTGLGLAISRDIVSAHGGRIWAAPRPGGGTSVFVDLPADPSPQGAPS